MQKKSPVMAPDWGLHYVKQIAETAIMVRSWCESKEGIGSTFFMLKLPKSIIIIGKIKIRFVILGIF